MTILVGNLVGQIVDRMQQKTKDETKLIPGSNLVLYSAVSFVYLIVIYMEGFTYVNMYGVSLKLSSY